MKRVLLPVTATLLTNMAFAKVGEIDHALSKGELSYEATVGAESSTTNESRVEYKQKMVNTSHTLSYAPIENTEVAATLTYSELVKRTEAGVEDKKTEITGLEDLELSGSYAIGSLGLGAMLAISPEKETQKEDKLNNFSGGQTLELSATYDFSFLEKIVLQPELLVARTFGRKSKTTLSGETTETKYEPRLDYSVGVNGQFLASEKITLLASLSYAVEGKEKEDKAGGEESKSFYTIGSTVGANYYLKEKIFVGAELGCDIEEDRGETKDTSTQSVVAKFGMQF